MKSWPEAMLTILIRHGLIAAGWCVRDARAASARACLPLSRWLIPPHLSRAAVLFFHMFVSAR